MEILSSGSVGLCRHCSSAMGREFLRSWDKVEGGDKDAEWGDGGVKNVPRTSKGGYYRMFRKPVYSLVGLDCEDILKFQFKS